jgi:alkaline phosphatase
MTANPVLAQVMLPTDNQWFINGQATLQERLSAAPNTNTARNVILFVADGNGVGTNYATRLFQGQQMGLFGEEHVLSYEVFPYLALVKTYNINAQTPDSAPTAGAMNTGVKQIFNTINLNEAAIHNDCSSEAGNQLPLFSQIVTEMGRSVGVVSTARITHATPAAVFANTANRNWEGEAPDGCIDIAQQLFNAIGDGTVDFALGGGARYFAPSDRADGRDLIAEAQAAGVQFASDTPTFEALNLDGETPVLGLFTASHMAYEYDRVAEAEPSIAEMTAAAIEYLSQNEEGYYLMVEAGRVDHANHAGNLYRALSDGAAFADAVAMAMQMTSEQDTLIIVTADHEHAISFNGYCGRGSPITGLCMGIATGEIAHTGEPNLAADDKPYTVVGYLNGPGAIVTEQMDGNYFGTRPSLTNEIAMDPDYIQQAAIPMSSETHTGVDVALYARGPWSHLFGGTIEQNYIFHVMMHAVDPGMQRASQ